MKRWVQFLVHAMEAERGSRGRVTCTVNFLKPNGFFRGGVVVKALRYKPAGRRFNSRWCHWNFSVT